MAGQGNRPAVVQRGAGLGSEPRHRHTPRHELRGQLSRASAPDGDPRLEDRADRRPVPRQPRDPRSRIGHQARPNRAEGRLAHHEAGLMTASTAATALDPSTSAQFLGGLGFLLTPDGEGTEFPSYLLVALREQPTLCHFDPERVEYWRESEGHSNVDLFSRATPLPVDQSFTWGLI